MNTDSQPNQSRRPNTSAFHQQKYSGWKPNITTHSLYFIFFAIGIVCIVVGSVLIFYSYQITEMNIDYTNCKTSNGEICSEQLSKLNYTYFFKSCQCEINITVPQDIKNNVYIYYGLSNFFQNHRRYVKSRDDKQLRGLDVNGYLSSDCEPFLKANANTVYAPCGIIANSLFNDTFELKYVTNNSIITVPWKKTGIAWPSETNVRFGQPNNWKNTTKPPNWPISEQERSKTAYSGDEELIVWMRTAAFPNFKKLHRIVEHTQAPFETGLPQGSYRLSINYSYPVISFQGTKRFILSTTNYLGGKNTGLGIVYLSVGTIYFSIAIAFVFINQFVSKRRSNEAWYIASQNASSGCRNETFCHIESDNNNGFVDQCSSVVHRRV